MESKLLALFKTTFGEEVISTESLMAHASTRTLYRIKSKGRSVVGVYHSNKPENRAFISFSRHFKRFNLPVPEIYAENLDDNVYLVEDLGDVTLFDRVTSERDKGGGFSESLEQLYHAVVEFLPRFQVEAGDTIDFSLCTEGEEFGADSMLQDMKYFQSEFLDRSGVGYDSSLLEKDFARLTNFLLGAERKHFLYRDFQARNIMIKGNSLYFIDYQSGRRGPVHYDLASLLYQSQARIPSDARDRIIKTYLANLEKLIPVQRDTFMSYFYSFVTLRYLQVLGAYGKLGLGDGKQYFIDGIPVAIDAINSLLDSHPLPTKLVELERVLRTLRMQRDKKDAKLTINVQSFSYRDGLPTSSSENGGGFVFDCRCVPNPGREAAFSELTGKDQKVQDYLARQPAANRFFSNVEAMVFQAIENYLARGFSSLEIAFGCTGGQHRSVYFAEELTKKIKEKFPVDVKVTHRDIAKMRGRKS